MKLITNSIFILFAIVTLAHNINTMEDTEESDDEEITAEEAVAEQIFVGEITPNQYKTQLVENKTAPEQITTTMKCLSELCGTRIKKYADEANADLQQGKASNLQLHTAFGFKHIPGINKVTKLDLSYNCLTTTEGLEKLQQNSGWFGSLVGGIVLRVLDLSHNNLKDISELSCLTHLEELYLDCNFISSIENLKALSKLKILEAYENCLSTVDVSTLTALHRLNLSHNSITTIVGLQNLSQLTVLYLWNNKLSEEEREKIRKVHPKIKKGNLKF